MSEHNNPGISVVIPVYQRQKLLTRALGSVLQQSVAVDAIIIVDDGSFPAIASAYKDSRIHIIRIPHSGMPGKVRNAGLKHVRSEWVAFLDSDDMWLPEKLECQCTVLKQQSDADCVFTREYWIRKGKLSVAPEPIQNYKKLFETSVQKCTMGPSTIMVKSDILDLLQGFREDLVFAEDYECWLRLLLRTKAFALERPLILKYAAMGDNLSETTPMQELYRLKALVGVIEQVGRGTLGAETWQWELLESAFRTKLAIVKTGALKHRNAAILEWIREIELSTQHR